MLSNRHAWMQFWTLNLNTSLAKLYKLRGRNCRARSIGLDFFRFSGLSQCSGIISARKGLWRPGLIYSWSPLKALSSGVLLRQIYFPLQVCLPCTLYSPMPTHTLSVDTSVLPVGVLSFYDVQFYDLVERIAGVAEAALLEIQGIRSVYSFLNTDDVFEILSVPCAALNNVRKLVCLEKMDKTFTVTPGCRSSTRYLSQLLNRRHEEHMKDIGAQSKRNKQRPALISHKTLRKFSSHCLCSSRMHHQVSFHIE
jgi:hypothetical protein